MNALLLIIGLLAGWLVAGIAHRVTAGFCLPKFVQAAAMTGWFAFVGFLFALLLFCLDAPPDSDVPWGAVTFAGLALTTLGGWLTAVYVRYYEITGLQAFGVVVAKLVLLSCMTGLIADFVQYLVASGVSDFWFAYGLSLALTFLVLETTPPTR